MDLFRITIAIVIGTFSAPAPTQATVVVTLSGVLYATAQNPSGWDESMVIGVTPFQATYTFGDDGIDDFPSNPNLGIFAGTGSEWSVNAAFGDYNFSTVGASYDIRYGDGNGSRYQFVNPQGFSGSEFTAVSLWTFLDSSNETLISTDQRVWQFPVEAFNVHREFFFAGDFQGGPTTTASFTVDSLQVVSVPEPSSAWFIGMGLCGWILAGVARSKGKTMLEAAPPSQPEAALAGGFIGTGGFVQYILKT